LANSDVTKKLGSEFEVVDELSVDLDVPTTDQCYRQSVVVDKYVFGASVAARAAGDVLADDAELLIACLRHNVLAVSLVAESEAVEGSVMRVAFSSADGVAFLICTGPAAISAVTEIAGDVHGVAVGVELAAVTAWAI